MTTLAELQQIESDTARLRDTIASECLTWHAVGIDRTTYSTGEIDRAEYSVSGSWRQGEPERLRALAARGGALISRLPAGVLPRPASLTCPPADCFFEALFNLQRPQPHPFMLPGGDAHRDHLSIDQVVAALDHLLSRLAITRHELSGVDSSLEPGGATGTEENNQTPTPVSTQRWIRRAERGGWTVHFDGSERSFDDRDGFFYISELLKHQGLVPATTLYSSLKRAERVASTGTQLPRDAAGEGGLNASGESDATLDPEARRNYTSRLQQIQDEATRRHRELKCAQSSRDEPAQKRFVAELEQFADEADFIRAELGGATGLGGRSRAIVPGEATKHAESVQKAIKAVINLLRKGGPAAAADHLERSGISNRRAGAFSYEPSEDESRITV